MKYLIKITLDIALKTIRNLKNNGIKLVEGAFTHSDQGFHYTNPRFQKVCEEKGIRTVNVPQMEIVGITLLKNRSLGILKMKQI